MLASAVKAAVAAKCQVPVFLGAMAVLANNGLVALAWRSRRLPFWLSLRLHRAQQCLHSASRWRPLQRWLFGPRLQLVLTGAARNSKSSGSCASAGASASSGKFSAGGGRSPHRSFSGRCSSHRLLGSSPGSHQRLLPNPSLEWTATGKPPWPRGAVCLSCASRPSRLTGVRPSAQTLGGTGNLVLDPTLASSRTPARLFVARA